MPSPITYHLVPHTHWDREWYLTRAGFVARLVPVLDDLVGRLDGDPGFRSFLLDGQTVLVEDYLRVRPEQAAVIAALVGEGRLQLGPWYVLADELVPSGESLVRNLLAGRADADRLGGRLDVLYSPDAFGHPAAWPMLAAEFGIRYGVIWRGLGGEPRQDGDLYRWRDAVGRELLLYHLPPQGYEVGAALPADPERLAPAWRRLAPVLRARAASAHVAVFVGADHNAVHPEIGRLRDLVAGLEPEANVRISRLDEFLAEASAAAFGLPLLEGEQRWSYGYTWTLQGVHGTRAPLKRRHADVELALERIAEPLAALDLWYRGRDSRPLLNTTWRTLLRSQFHDSICGCTSDPVARRVRARVDDAAVLADEIARSALYSLAGHAPDAAREAAGRAEPRLVFWNPAPRARAGVVVADLTWFRQDVLVGPPGTRQPRRASAPSDAEVAAALGGAPHQVLGQRLGQERLDALRHSPDQDEVEIVRVALPAPRLGGFSLAEGAGDVPSHSVTLTTGGLANGMLETGIDRGGRVWLRVRQGGVRLTGLFALESEPDAGDTYTFAHGAGTRESTSRWTSARVLAAGPLVGAIEARTVLLGGQAGARLVLSLHAGSGALRATLELENRATDHRLRLRFPLGERIFTTLAGSAFGAVHRPVVAAPGREYPAETPVTSGPAQRFVLAQGGTRGLAVFAPGFFEYEPIGADLAVTLLRAVGQLSRSDLPTRPGHAGWPTATPEAQCLGSERVQFGLMPFDGAAGGDQLARIWEDLFLPPRAIWLRQCAGLDLADVDVRLEGEGLVFSALKPAEDGSGVVIRCYNPGAGAVEGILRLGREVTAAARVRADERERELLPLDPGGRSLRFRARAGEVVTIALPPVRLSG